MTDEVIDLQELRNKMNPKFIVTIIVIIFILIAAFSSFYTVKQEEEAVVLLFGVLTKAVPQRQQGEEDEDIAHGSLQNDCSAVDVDLRGPLGDA